MHILLILFLVGCGFAVKSGLDHVRTERRAGRDKAVKAAEKALGSALPKGKRRAVVRRHAAGYWAREILGGFPVARTGAHAGWLAHKAASDHHKAVREEARTTHLETRASFLPALKEYKKRQQAARDDIYRVMAGDPGTPRGKEAVRKASDAVILHPDFPRTAPEPAPADDVNAHWGDPLPGEDALLDPRPRTRPACGACGHPGSDADPLVSAEGASVPVHRSHVTDPASGFYDPAAMPLPAADREPSTTPGWMPPSPEAAAKAQRFLDLRESGWTGAIDQDGNAVMGRTSPDGQPLPLFEGGTGHGTPDDWPTGRKRTDQHGARKAAQNGTTTTQSPATGGTTVSETTFTTVIESARGSAAASEGSLAGIRAQREHYERMADEMQALEVDPGNLSAVMDIIDGYRKAEEAMAGLQDTATALPQGLQRDHGQLDSAHREAPVRAAHRGFYAEGEG